MGVKGYHDLDRGSPLVSRGWHNTKLALRIFSILLCSAAIGIQVPTALRYKTEANRLQIDYDAAVDIAITIAPPLVITLFDIAEVITVCLRRGRRGLHPGFHVAFELVFWLATGVLTALIARIAFVADDNAAYIRGVVDSEAASDLISYADLQIFEGFALKTKVAAALFGLLAATRFVLFARACVEVHQRRNAKRGRGPSIVMTRHDGEAAVPLTPYQTAVPLHAGPQYYDYSKPVVQVNVAEYPVHR